MNQLDTKLMVGLHGVCYDVQLLTDNFSGRVEHSVGCVSLCVKENDL